MRFVGSSEMREIDKRTIESGIPGVTLMETAGTAVARFVREIATCRNAMNPVVLLVAGNGNNGGDAFVAARVLLDYEFRVHVLCTCPLDRVSGDALTHLERLRSRGIEPGSLCSSEDWDGYTGGDLPEPDIVVDGILGTGVEGPARGAAASAMRFLKRRYPRSLVVAIDLPSGLNADTGEAAGETVTADFTVTMGLPKKGFIAGDGPGRVGSVEVADIGIPGEFTVSSGNELELVISSEVSQLFKRRRIDSHKGVYGHALLIGGARGYSGAIAMAAQAAVRSGAGLVSALVPERIAGTVAVLCQEAMVHGGAESRTGSLSSACLAGWSDRMEQFDSILIGPGMTPAGDTRRIVLDMLRSSTIPVVLDADAINVIKCADISIKAGQCPVVMTPHPGELSRFLGRSVEEVQHDRVGTCREAAERTGAVVVLKGSGTVIARSEGPVCINLTGNAGMACGGMGDVLAGLIAGCLAQGIDPFQGASAAVYIHGRAGDRAALGTGQLALSAGDVIRSLCSVLRDLAAR